MQYQAGRELVVFGVVGDRQRHVYNRVGGIIDIRMVLNRADVLPRVVSREKEEDKRAGRGTDQPPDLLIHMYLVIEEPYYQPHLLLCLLSVYIFPPFCFKLSSTDPPMPVRIVPTLAAAKLMRVQVFSYFRL